MITKTRITMAALVTLLVLGFTAESNAQGLRISFGKHHRNQHFGISLGFGHQERHHHSDCCRRWVPPCTQVDQERVWVPGCSRRVWVPPVYETRYDHCGNPIQVLVRAGYHQVVQDGGHWEVQERHVTVPGRWEYVCGY